MVVETITDGGILYGLLAVGAGLATGLAGIGAGVGGIGIRAAGNFGGVSATNNVEIVTNQQ